MLILKADSENNHCFVNVLNVNKNEHGHQCDTGFTSKTNKQASTDVGCLLLNGHGQGRHRAAEPHWGHRLTSEVNSLTSRWRGWRPPRNIPAHAGLLSTRHPQGQRKMHTCMTTRRQSTLLETQTCELILLLCGQTKPRARLQLLITCIEEN